MLLPLLCLWGGLRRLESEGSPNLFIQGTLLETRWEHGACVGVTPGGVGPQSLGFYTGCFRLLQSISTQPVLSVWVALT